MKKSFRFLALALLPVLLAGMLVPCFAWSEPNDLAVRRYKDLSAKAWYYEDVAWVAKTGLMQYSNDPQKFEPQSPLTRAMFTQICYNFLSKGLEKDVSYDAVAPFTDVKKSSWFCDAVSFAYENGIVNGMGAGRFAPLENITRQQMAVLYRGLIENYFGVQLPVDLSVLDQFTDRDSIASWAKESVAAIVGIGLLYGKDGARFDPAGVSTRAEAAALIRRFYIYYTMTPQCYVADAIGSQALIPTMIDEFDGEGTTGWNHDLWTPVAGGYASYLPPNDITTDVDGTVLRAPYSGERMYTKDGALYLNAYYPTDGKIPTNSAGTSSQNHITGLFSGHDIPNKFAQSYGFYEVRFKPCPARYICSAYWLTTNAEGDPDNWVERNPDGTIKDPENALKNFVEFDIFESEPIDINNSFIRKKVMSTLHWNQFSSATDHVYVGEHTYVAGNRLRSGPYLPDSFYDGNYHTIGFLWSKDTYSVWYDGVFAYEYQNVPPTDCPAVLRLNIYYWCDLEDLAPYRSDYDADGIASFVVDYIKVFQLSDYLTEYAPKYYGNPTPEYYTQAKAALDR